MSIQRFSMFTFFKSRLFIAACTIISIAGMQSCTTSPYYQKQDAIPGAKWDYSFQPVYKINIPDSGYKYATYLLVRHDEAYKFSNIWIRMKVKAPGDTAFSEGVRIDRTIADASGKWQSNAMAVGGIWEHKMPINAKEISLFSKPGMYEIKLEQVMRVNPLPSVINVGLRVERLGK